MKNGLLSILHSKPAIMLVPGVAENVRYDAFACISRWAVGSYACGKIKLPWIFIIFL